MRGYPVNDEKILLSQVASGDEKAFARLFHLYEANIYPVVLRLTRDQQVTEEILQDVFLKVWLKKEQLPELNNFGGWLYTIAENITFNHLKSLQRTKANHLRFTIEGLPINPVSSEDELMDKEYQSLLNQAIERLPHKQKQTYLLIKQDQLTREQAARQLQVDPETVKSNLDSAMRNIRAFCVAHLQWILL